jgi:hypothetical protein
MMPISLFELIFEYSSLKAPLQRIEAAPSTDAFIRLKSCHVTYVTRQCSHDCYFFRAVHRSSVILAVIVTSQ